MYLSISTDDLTFQAHASQSPILPVSYPYELYEANNAIDRNTAKCMRTDNIGFNSQFKFMWWKLDLGGVYNIYSIHILFKEYEQYGMYVISVIKP